MIPRNFNLLKTLEKKSCFLFGPRQTGKSSLVKQQFEDCLVFNLLDHRIYLELAKSPGQLRDWIPKDYHGVVVLDEIQKLPELLDEVQYLIDERGVRFLMTGSSTRKMKTKGVNLLGGRARSRFLHPFSASELKDDFDLIRALNYGLLPPIYLSDDPKDDLKAYCGDYLRMEVAQEGLTRNIAAFSRVLEVAAATNTSIINYSKISSDAAVARTTVMEYFQILRDTLIGFDLRSWKKTVKRKPISTSKFYFFDGGVARALKNGPLYESESYELGEAFETWVCHELKAFTDYHACEELHYWRSQSDLEVDFIFNGTVAIEVKSTKRVIAEDFKGLRALKEESTFKHYFLVCREERIRQTEDGITVLPWKDFVTQLWNQDWI